MVHPSNSEMKVYARGEVQQDQYEKDKSSFSTKGFYAVKERDTVVIKQIFASVGSFFEFLGSLLFNNKNTFFQDKTINLVVNSLVAIYAGRTSRVGTAALQARTPSSPETPPPPPSLESSPKTPMKTPKGSLEEKFYTFTDQALPYRDMIESCV